MIVQENESMKADTTSSSSERRRREALSAPTFPITTSSLPPTANRNRVQRRRFWQFATTIMSALLIISLQQSKQRMILSTIASSWRDNNFAMTQSKKQNTTATASMGYVRQPFVYAHVHMAKTGGSELNGELSLHFERICGNKGNSNDAIQTNLRFNQSSHNYQRQNDLISKFSKNHNRGKVPLSILQETGFEDCDYISVESNWAFWTKLSQYLNETVELHVPCRDPLDHLMSQCNHRQKAFDCSAKNLRREIKKCIVSVGGRFSKELETSSGNINVKCFDFRKQFTDYMAYMGERLQRRRVEAQYVHRDTNRPRNKTLECVWTRQDVREKIKNYLVSHYDYYNFCHRCLGTGNDLLMGNEGTDTIF